MNKELTTVEQNFKNIELNKNIAKDTIYKCIKRLFDICLGIVGCVVLIPISIIIKICYLISGDKKSIIFAQKRIGKDGKRFTIYKFRTMVPKADKVLFNLLKKDSKLAEEYRINKKIENDPRETKVGRVIRKLYIDELPQLINVLKGDMSLVGNRPYLIREKKDMDNYYEDIIKTKPGLTGLWQVSKEKNVKFKDRLELEKIYSDNCNLKTDIKIFFKTFKIIIGGFGIKIKIEGK